MFASVSDSLHQLRISQLHWSRAIASLIQNPSSYTTGSILPERTKTASRLVVENLQVVSETPCGSDRGALDAWCVIMIADNTNGQSLDAASVVSRFKPKFSQHFAILIVGMGQDRDGWMGWSIHRSEVAPLGGFRVIGARGFVASTSDHANHEFVIQQNTDRWSRVAGALGAEHASVRSATVAIVGCSRSGTVAATQLAALGIRKLILFDGDRIEPHNLDGIYLATPGDVGKPKASILADRLIAYRPDIAIGVVNRALNEYDSIESSTKFDLVITCVDNDDARVAASRIASRRLIPHLDIASELSEQDSGTTFAHADVRFLYPRDGCVTCVGGTQETDQGELARMSLPGVLPPRRSPHWNRQRRGSLITINSMAVSTGVQTWLASLQGRLTASTWHRLAWAPDGNLQMNSAPVSAAPGCKICE